MTADILRRLLAALAVTASLTATAPVRAAEAEDADHAAATEEDYYYQATPSAGKPVRLSQVKAAARAEQRMARLDAMRWYGFSGSRPTATAMAFTTMYSPAWQQPGGRPFAWYHASRPLWIYGGGYAIYR